MTHHQFGPGVARALHRIDDLAPTPPDFDDVRRQASGAPERVRSRRSLVLAVSTVLVLGAAGLVWLRATSDPAVDPVSTTPSTMEPAPVPPTATTQPDTTTTATTAPPTTLPQSTPNGAVLPSFTRLAPTSLPDGYSLERAVWERLGDMDTGYATYRTEDSDGVIGVTIRGAADFFANRANAGAPVTAVGDRPVYADTQTGTCDGVFCSLGVQWDASTAVSVEWSSPSGQSEAGLTVDDLVGIVESLEPSADTWFRGALQEYFAQDGACSTVPDDVIPFVLSVVPDGYQLAFAHYEETPEGTYGLARYDAAGGPEVGGNSITVIGRPTPMWPATLERPVVSDTGPFVLRDASQLEGGSDNYRAVGFEVAGRNYITVDSDGNGAFSFEQLAALADGLFATCSAYQLGPLQPE
jgi:hypothetical protein